MKITNTRELDLAINDLEQRVAGQQKVMVAHFHKTYESFRPHNLLKSVFQNAVKSTDTQNTIFKIVGGLASILLTNTLFSKLKTNSTATSLLNKALKIGTSKVLYNNVDKIKAYGQAIYDNVFKKKSKEN